MKQSLKYGLRLLCSANMVLWSSSGFAGTAAQEPPISQQADSAEREQALKTAEQIGSRVLVTMADGTQKTLKELLTASEHVENMIFHIPEYNLHLRMKAKPSKDSWLLVFQILDADGHETDRMTQVKIDPKTDQAVLFSHLQDSMKVLTAHANISKNIQAPGQRSPASACRESQTRDEQLRDLLFHLSLVASGSVLAILAANGHDFALLSFPVLVLGGSLAYYGVRLIHTDLLPPCPRT